MTVSLTFFVGERRDRPLLHLHVEAAREAGRHRCARRGRGVRVAAGKQQKLHVLRDAVAEGRASQGENALCSGSVKVKVLLIAANVTGFFFFLPLPTVTRQGGGSRYTRGRPCRHPHRRAEHQAQVQVAGGG